jgi:Fe-S cluster biogenesis protein NfuA
LWEVLDVEDVSSALEEVRGLLQADGGDMELTRIDAESGSVSLRLVVEGASCEECVLPREFLEQITLDIFRRASTDVNRVEIDDPREHPDYVPSTH